VRQAFFMAQEVGHGVGAGDLLLRSMPQQFAQQAMKKPVV